MIRHDAYYLTRRFLVLVLGLIYCYYATAQNSDIDLLRRINSKQSKTATTIFKLSSNSIYVIPIAYPVFQFGYGKYKKNDALNNDAWFSTLSLLTTAVVTFGLKEIIQRPRPFITYPDIKVSQLETSPSLPSAHASIAFCAATSISLYYKKWYIVVPAFAWACSVSYSRIYLGQHYPTDVIGGMFVGSAIPLLFHYCKPLNTAVKKVINYKK